MKKILTLLLIAALLLTGCAYTVDEPAPFTIFKGRTGDDTYQPIELEPDSRSVKDISLAHAEIHDGDSFKADINSDDIDSEGTNNALHISFTTANNTKWSHILITATATGSAQISFIEAPTGGVAGGTRLDVFNRDRNSAQTSGMTSSANTTANEITQDAIAPTGGTEIHHWVLGSGKNKIGGGVREVEEFILKQNTIYSIRLTANVDNIRGQLTASWYELTNEEP